MDTSLENLRSHGLTVGTAQGHNCITWCQKYAIERRRCRKRAVLLIHIWLTVPTHCVLSASAITLLVLLPNECVSYSGFGGELQTIKSTRRR